MKYLLLALFIASSFTFAGECTLKIRGQQFDNNKEYLSLISFKLEEQTENAAECLERAQEYLASNHAYVGAGLVKPYKVKFSFSGNGKSLKGTLKKEDFNLHMQDY